MAQKKQLEIDAKTLEAWKRRYAQEIGGAATDDEELAKIRAQRERFKAGLTWDENGNDVHIGVQQEWTPEAVRGAAGDVRTGEAPRAMLYVVGGVMLTLFACMLTVLFWPSGSTAAASTTRTPVVTTSQTRAPGLALGLPVIVSGDNRLPFDAPRSLEIARQPFQVSAGKIAENGGLQFTPIEGAQAVWFPSPANWMFGLSQNVIDALQFNDVIIARTSAGSTRQFVVDGIDNVAPQEIEKLTQRRAGLVMFPLPSKRLQVRLVSARYDPTGEMATTVTAAQGGARQIVNFKNGQAIVLEPQIARSADGLYVVTVTGEVSVPASAAALEINGQLYPASGELRAAVFNLPFTVSELGRAALLLDETRIDLGTLKAPTLSGQMIAAQVTGKMLKLTITLAAQGGQAGIRPGDVVMMDDVLKREVSAQSMQPPSAMIAPGQPQTVTFQFALPAQGGSVRIKVIDQLWQIDAPLVK
jgi:hypothetical protein